MVNRAAKAAMIVSVRDLESSMRSRGAVVFIVQ